MIISSIVAMAENRVIGKNNDIPWYLPADLKYFKKVTLNHPIIMGRKCYNSIGRPLPKRTNIVMTRDPFFLSTGIVVAHSLEMALQIARDTDTSECFIIGGGEIYNQSMDFIDRLYVTEVDTHVEGDVFFPEFDLTKWELMDKEEHQADEKNEFDYSFLVYHKK